MRRDEAQQALTVLGVPVVNATHCQLPDSGLASRADLLVEVIEPLVAHADLVLAPWRGDGHPDHEAVGRAAALCGRPLLEYPIWMWHWAEPNDQRVPWSRCHVVPVDAVTTKRAAIETFVTQVLPIGPDPADAAILPPSVKSRFLRRFEMVIS
jgi:LmbE family N-acetylglucosaminyl deacetylase